MADSPLSGVVLTFTANITEATGEMTALADRAAALGESFTAVGAQTAAGMEEASGSVTGFSGDVEAQAGKVTASNDEILASMAKLSEAADKTAEQFYVDYAGMAAQTQKLAANMETADAKAIAATEAMGAKIDEAAAKPSAAAAAFTSAGTKIGLAGAVISGVAVKMAADFQSSTTRLVTSAGETEANLTTVRNGILAMAGAVGTSAEDLSKGMYTVESAGYHGAAGLTVLKAAAQGAKEENASLTTVADAVSTALTDYHLPASQAALVTSQLVAAVGQGKTTMEEFSSSLHSITPLAASLHLSLADVTGTLAEMTDHGMSADQASQNLADTLRHMISPTQSQRAELAQLGLTATDLSDSLGTKGLSGTLDMLSQDVLQKMGPSGKMLLNAFNTSKDAANNLKTALAALPPATQKLAQGMEDGTVSAAQWTAEVKGLPENQKLLAQSFLSIYTQANGFTNALKNGSPQAQNYTQAIKALTGDATGLNTTLMVTGENAAGTANNIKVIAEAATEAGGNVKGWHDIQENFNQKVSEAKDGLGAMAIAVGEKLLPALTAIAGVIGDVTQWLSKHQAAATAVAIVIGGALVVGLAAATVATWSWTAALLANPAVWIVAGIMALIAAIILLVTHWKQIESWLRGVWNGFINWAKGIWNTVADFFVGLWNTVKNLFVRVWTEIGVWLITKWAEVIGWATSIWNGIVNFFVGLWNTVKGWFISAWVSIGVWLIGKWAEVINWAKNAWNTFIGFFENLWNHIRNGVVNAWNSVLDFFRSIPGKVADFFRGAGEWLLNAGKSILDGLLNGLKSAWNAITNFVGNIGNWISSHKGPIDYDRQLLVPHGNAIMAGLLDGLTTGGKKVASYLDGFTTQVGSPSVLGDLSVSGTTTLVGGLGVPSAGGGAPTIVVNVAGSAVTERDLATTMQKIMLQLGTKRPVAYQNYRR